VSSGQLDVTDAYTTDGELDAYDLRLLLDDRGFFPGYDAALLTRSDLPVPVAEVLQRLADMIDEPTMRALNFRVANENRKPGEVAATFLHDSGLAGPAQVKVQSSARRILGYTAVHLKLTASALLLACLIAIPLALVLARYAGVARGLLYVTGLIQTIPALALLALLIPLVGLGQAPAIIALFLYSLLPIVRNTLTGIFSVDPLLKQVATGMGLTPMQQLWKVELPLAMPTILAGIKTAAIICIGTATLAAFVGAGGLGEPIITGLTLNDNRLILEGAIPAALLAIAVELLFELVERIAIPAHLRD
jgi:osmoprotectant transport system permease protein